MKENVKKKSFKLQLNFVNFHEALRARHELFNQEGAPLHLVAKLPELSLENSRKSAFSAGANLKVKISGKLKSCDRFFIFRRF
jgi:hypothetical protein